MCCPGPPIRQSENHPLRLVYRGRCVEREGDESGCVERGRGRGGVERVL